MGGVGWEVWDGRCRRRSGKRKGEGKERENEGCARDLVQ